MLTIVRPAAEISTCLHHGISRGASFFLCRKNAAPAARKRHTRTAEPPDPSVRHSVGAGGTGVIVQRPPRT